MIWIIIVAAILAVAATLWASRRMKVLASKKELESSMQSVKDSFGDLRKKIAASDLRQNEKNTLDGNVQRNIDQLDRWMNTAVPNITFWKNHPEPIQKEFADMQESVARELSQYKDLPNPLA